MRMLLTDYHSLEIDDADVYGAGPGPAELFPQMLIRPA